MKSLVVVKWPCFIPQYSEQHKERLNTDFMHSVPQLTNTALLPWRIEGGVRGRRVCVRVCVCVCPAPHTAPLTPLTRSCGEDSVGLWGRNYEVPRMNLSFHFNHVKSYDVILFYAVRECVIPVWMQKEGFLMSFCVNESHLTWIDERVLSRKAREDKAKTAVWRRKITIIKTSYDFVTMTYRNKSPQIRHYLK